MKVIKIAGLLCFLVVVTSAILMFHQHIIAPQVWEMQVACRQNLSQSIGPALTNYKKENGHYPANLAALIPKYLQTIPVCPATTLKIAGYPTALGGKDTYSAGYQLESNKADWSVICTGSQHRDAEKIGMRNPDWFSP